MAKQAPRGIQGNLGVFQVYAVYEMIHMAHATGVLALQTPGNIAKIFFKGGRICFAWVKDPLMKLGEHLIEEGWVEPVDIKIALKNQDGSRKLGELLVDNKVIDQSSLNTF